MNSITTSLLSFGFISAGILLGFILGRLLPEHHLSGDSKDAIKMAWGMVATMAALVLGLLVASAKGTFDTVNSETTQIGAKIIVLDHVLASYGPETRPIRETLRNTVASKIQKIWPGNAPAGSVSTELEQGNGLAGIEDALNQLAPQTDNQRTLLTQARQICGDILMARWLIIEQSSMGLPMVLLIVLVSWLTMLCFGIGMLAPQNRTVLIALFLCNISFSTAIFLINEMDRPLDGIIKISSVPLNKVLEHLDQ